eukprot:scaffold47181_cov57-Phaeocystis_antarctica.AAC.2
MHCGSVASAASTESTGAFGARGRSPKLSRLLPTCPRASTADEPDHLRLRRGRCRAQCDPRSRQSARAHGCELREAIPFFDELVGHEREQVSWKRRQR